MFLVFAVDADFALRVSKTNDVSTVLETDGQLKGRRAVVTRSLVPLAGVSSMACLKLSTVGVEVESYWSWLSMRMIFVL